MRRLQRWQGRDDTHPDLGWQHEVLHWIYEPADWGRKEMHEVRWSLFHHIHFMPIGMLAWFCKRAERKKSDG